MAENFGSPVDMAIAIIGANGRLGSSIALRLAQDSAVTVGYYRNRQKAEDVVAHINDFGLKATIGQVDVSDGLSVEKFLEEAARYWGRLDTVVMACGASIPICPIVEVPDETFRLIVETEVVGAFNIVKRGINILRQQKGTNRSLLFLLSTAVLRTLEYDGCSAVPKMAILKLIQQTTREIGSEGIRLNAVGVGSFAGLADQQEDEVSKRSYIDQLVAACRSPANRTGDPKELASVVAFLVSKDASYVNGQILGVDGGHSA
ncbi:uncharacterized protein A1O9_12847 [Exophiala aquamarina CBS 119918]|uniref:3-oxoacyl-[acyl-carrier protein] reductase n=1 Tax=Exophiala aquamarina CBS 119918 TaxID=1182545 RepID=A0A072NTB5_9EURO|nr:uncharacterized protein A1O9_12847 [Exophiala aquamarina CBS 119918]KEF51124.1 hypothetical protein A1O9_12847 [Exophiala aquamarina CBS 119918]